MNNLKNLRGTVDLLPDQLIKWQNVEKIILEQLARASISEIRTPILEMTELFIRGVGEEQMLSVRKCIHFLIGVRDPVLSDPKEQPQSHER